MRLSGAAAFVISALALALAAPGAHAQGGQVAVPPSAPVPPTAASAPVVTVQVERFDVQGNTLLPAAAIEQRLVEFKGSATLSRLRDAAAAVQELYRRAGYGGVVAFLPQQSSAGGVVVIRVVEGKLTRIDISDNKQFSEANIRASLPALKTGVTPDVRRIDAEIQLANENPSKTVQVLLQPGDTPGSIAAKLAVAEQPIQRFTARVDNTGSERTGRWRAALGWQHANLFDADHVTGVELQTAPEQPSAVAVVSGNYRVPLYGRAMAIDAYAAWSDVDAGKTGTAAGDLQFSGRGYILGVRGSAYLPRLANIDQRLMLGLELREYLNSCAIEGLPEGACGTAGASVSVQPLSLTYTVQAVSDFRAALSLGLVANLGAGGRHGDDEDFESVRHGSSRHYTALRVSGSLAAPVSTFGIASLRASGQYSAKPLVPGELFGVGGALSVRGYEERELSGDSGVQMTLEYQTPDAASIWPAMQGVDLRGVVFADGGIVSNQQDDACLAGRSRCSMGSFGAGVRVGWRQAQMRLDVARAMRDAPITRKGDFRGHFSLAIGF